MHGSTDRFPTRTSRGRFIAGTVIGVIIGVAVSVLIRRHLDLNVRNIQSIQAAQCLGRSGKAIAAFMQAKGRAPADSAELTRFDPTWHADVTSYASDWDARIEIFWECIGEPEAPIWGITHPTPYERLPNDTFREGGKFYDLRAGLYPDGSIQFVSAGELSAALRIVSERRGRARPATQGGSPGGTRINGS